MSWPSGERGPEPGPPPNGEPDAAREDPGDSRGAAFARLVRRLGGRPVTVPTPLPRGVAVVHGRWIPALAGRLAGMRRAAAATTIGDTIIVHPDVRITDRLIRHELAHVRQWRSAPFTFPVRYALNHARFGYKDNPYEVEARRAEHE